MKAASGSPEQHVIALTINQILFHSVDYHEGNTVHTFMMSKHDNLATQVS